MFDGANTKKAFNILGVVLSDQMVSDKLASHTLYAKAALVVGKASAIPKSDSLFWSRFTGGLPALDLVGRCATDSPFGGSFDCAPGGAVLAGRFCGGASLRMTDLFLWLGLGAGEGHSLSEGSGIEAAGGGDGRSSRFRFPSALRTDSPSGGPSTARRGARFSLVAFVAALRSG
jgi:hypothetical protein